jgi:hypothetical protein
VKKLVIACLAALAAALPAGVRAQPVPSLTPSATHRLWLAEAARAKRHPRAVSDASCRPARILMYAQTDWLRLATKLAQSPSPCAEYFVSVPPLAADKTQPRANQAAAIRALGSQFHALDEISYTGWNGWVSAGNGSWFDAGVEARRRMGAAGFNAAAGDTWAMNEVSSAVRKGTGTARQNASEFLRGLAADGTRGVVLVTGVSQTTPDLSSYKLNLQSWLQDTGFWNQVSNFVSDWQQETYGDVRAYAATGTTPQQRRDALVQYLGHVPALAAAGPEAAGAARGLLSAAFGPLANGAWAWGSAYGWTSVPSSTMQDYVSAEVYAARGVAPAASLDRFGFAWAPSNTLGLAAGDFAAQTGAILDRLAAAIRDSGVPNEDPGAGACPPPWCTAVLDGAVLTPAWQAFSAWTQAGVVIDSAPVTMTAGAIAGPLSVAVQTGGVPGPAPADQPVTLTSSSPRGGFSTSPTGPWTAALTVTIPAGSPSTGFYYTDTLAGTPTIAAAVPGQAAATQVETVVPAGLTKLVVAPSTATLRARASQAFRATGTDAYGNAVAVAAVWTVAPALGRFTPAAGAASIFTAGATAGRAVLTATMGTLTAAARVTITKPAPRVASVGTKMVARHLVVTTRVLAAGQPAAGVQLQLKVRKGGSVIALVLGRTKRDGRLVWRSKHPLPRAHYIVRATIRSASTA